MPSGIKLKWTGKKCWEFAQKNNVNKTEKAGSFIHKAIYSSEATVAEEKKNVRGKKKYFEFIKLNNSTTLTLLLYYAPLRHKSNFLNILYMALHCFLSLPMQASMEGRWAPLSKEKQSIAERWKSQRGSALACECSPASLGSPSSACMCDCARVWMCLCVCECVHTSCLWAYAYMSVCLYVRCCMKHVYVCVQTGLINAAPPSGAMWVEWLVSTSWTLLTLSLPLPGELPHHVCLISSLEQHIFSCPIRHIYILLRAQLFV